MAHEPGNCRVVSGRSTSNITSKSGLAVIVQRTSKRNVEVVCNACRAPDKMYVVVFF
ncbi:hypothetical protein C4D60_Mb07t22920 [Musa balbisiana]|uniref:Uncharacterized protein n=1 Tax=Musa balbisiana TaxID=52838 RepID=A0A4S8JHB8_MUSBA|nr:hypothetical protein C4D60_Mb07t22920 [Musa balbisiana]